MTISKYVKINGFLILIALSVLFLVPASAVSSKVIAIDARDSLSLALKDDGTVIAWGTMRSFFPNGSYFFQSATPVAVNITNVSAISAGGANVLFLKNDGTVWAWGDNGYGQHGIGTNEFIPYPMQVKGLNDILAISTSGSHCLALRRDGTVWAWGWNMDGQLGIGTNSPGEHTPIQVTGLSNVKKISTGKQCSMAVDENGGLWVWGINDKGKLGDSTNITKLSPVRILIDNVIDVDAGEYAHVLALKSDGTVWAWGWNQEYELGVPGIYKKEYHTPVQIPELSDVKAISTTDSNSMVLKSDGTVWIWGNGQQGRLGNGALYSPDSVTPLQVPGLININAITAGSSHIIALSGDGSVYTWGDNSFGQIGNGRYNSYNTTYNYPEGVTIPTLIIIGGDGTTIPADYVPVATPKSNMQAEGNSSQNATGTRPFNINYLNVAGMLGIILVIGLILYVFIKKKYNT